MGRPKTDKTCCVYWLRRSIHSDILTEGYVGITTTTPEQRFKKHIRDSKFNKYTIHKALNKYDDFIISKIVIGSIDYCLGIEYALRPQKGIGYNLAEGGRSVIRSPDFVTSESTKEKLSRRVKEAYLKDPTLVDRCGKKNKGKKASLETRQLLSSLRTGKQVAWNNPTAKYVYWKLAPKIFEIMNLHPTHGVRRVATLIGLDFWCIKTIFDKIKTGWNPLTCQDYKNYIEQEQILCQL